MGRYPVTSHDRSQPDFERIVFEATTALRSPALGERQVLAALSHEHAKHDDLFRALRPLHEIEVASAPNTSALASVARIVFWNAERCKFVEQSAELLRPLEADVMMLAEMDYGMARSKQRHTTHDLAAALDTGYVFGVEFVELALGDARERQWHAVEQNRNGLHGGAILSPYRLERPALLRLAVDDRWWSGALKGERRIGGRIAMAAMVDMGGIKVALVATHLESHSDPDHRAHQFAVLLDAIDTYAAGAPVVFAGDLNTSTLSGDQDERQEERHRLALQDPNRFLHPEPYEPLFALAEQWGYQWRACNEPGVPTQRTRPDGTPQPPHGRIDWFFTRGVETFDPITIPAVDSDGKPISDHEVLAVTICPKRL